MLGNPTADSNSRQQSTVSKLIEYLHAMPRKQARFQLPVSKGYPTRKPSHERHLSNGDSRRQRQSTSPSGSAVKDSVLDGMQPELWTSNPFTVSYDSSAVDSCQHRLSVLTVNK